MTLVSSAWGPVLRLRDALWNVGSRPPTDAAASAICQAYAVSRVVRQLRELFQRSEPRHHAGYGASRPTVGWGIHASRYSACPG